ncbi:MAG: hypothetical protein NT086_10975 [Proteobacteria bacterium]|nr:hypothetical protein [Pseudomonadota bacterium]
MQKLVARLNIMVIIIFTLSWIAICTLRNSASVIIISTIFLAIVLSPLVFAISVFKSRPNKLKIAFRTNAIAVFCYTAGLALVLTLHWRGQEPEQNYIPMLLLLLTPSLLNVFALVQLQQQVQSTAEKTIN